MSYHLEQKMSRVYGGLGKETTLVDWAGLGSANLFQDGKYIGWAI